jgi:hypothetical protein
VGADPADIAERLRGIGEELADLALDRLREATDSVRAGGVLDPSVTAEEKRITRARRSVDKAASLLDGPRSASGAPEEGP